MASTFSQLVGSFSYSFVFLPTGDFWEPGMNMNDKGMLAHQLLVSPRKYTDSR